MTAKGGCKYPFRKIDGGKGDVHCDPVIAVKMRSDLENKFPDEPTEFIFDSGSNITVISWMEAARLGLDLNGDTWKPIQIEGVGGKIPALLRDVQLKINSFPPIVIRVHVSKEIPSDWRILGLEGIIDAFTIILHDYHTYVFLREDVEQQQI